MKYCYLLFCYIFFHIQLLSQNSININKENCTIINDVAFSENQKIMALALNDMSIKVFSLESGELIYYIKEHKTSVSCIALSNDGKQLASGDMDGNVMLFDLSTNLKKIFSKASFSDGYTISHIYFTKDNKYFISQSTGYSDNPPKQIIIWNIEKRNKYKVINTTSPWCNTVSCFNQETNTIAASHKSNSIGLIDLNTSKVKLIIEGDKMVLLGTTINPKGNLIATIGTEKSIKIWDSQKGNLLMELIGHTSAISSISFIDDNTLISFGADYTIRFWNIKEQKCFHSISIKENFSINYGFTSNFKFDNKILIVYHKKTIKLYDTRSGKELLNINSIDGKKDYVFSITNLYDGIIEATQDNNIDELILTKGLLANIFKGIKK